LIRRKIPPMADSTKFHTYSAFLRSFEQDNRLQVNVTGQGPYYNSRTRHQEDDKTNWSSRH